LSNENVLMAGDASLQVIFPGILLS
jgi:hypothetical protein